MQTVYYSTGNYIRHSGNVVDLTEYRRKLAQVDGSLALSEPVPAAEPEPAAHPVPTARPSRRPRRRSLADWLDFTATLALAAVGVTVWVQLVI